MTGIAPSCIFPGAIRLFAAALALAVAVSCTDDTGGLDGGGATQTLPPLGPNQPPPVPPAPGSVDPSRLNGEDFVLVGGRRGEDLILAQVFPAVGIAQAFGAPIDQPLADDIDDPISGRTHRILEVQTYVDSVEAWVTVGPLAGRGTARAYFFSSELFEAKGVAVDTLAGGTAARVFATPDLQAALVSMQSGAFAEARTSHAIVSGRGRNRWTLPEPSDQDSGVTQGVAAGPNGRWILFMDGGRPRVWNWKEPWSYRQPVDIDVNPPVLAAFDASLVLIRGPRWTDLLGNLLDVDGFEGTFFSSGYSVQGDQILELQEEGVVAVARTNRAGVIPVAHAKDGMLLYDPLADYVAFDSLEGEEKTVFRPPESPFPTDLDNPSFTTTIDWIQGQVTLDGATAVLNVHYEALNDDDRRSIGDLVIAWHISPNGSSRETWLAEGLPGQMPRPYLMPNTPHAVWMADDGVRVAHLEEGWVRRIASDVELAASRWVIHPAEDR